MIVKHYIYVDRETLGSFFSEEMQGLVKEHGMISASYITKQKPETQIHEIYLYTYTVGVIFFYSTGIHSL